MKNVREFAFSMGCALTLLATGTSVSLAAPPPGGALCKGPITLGTTIAETGVYAADTDKWAALTMNFQREINKRGGVPVKACGKSLPIKFVIYNDQSNPAVAVSLFQRLIEKNHVDFLVGPDMSNIGGPVAAVAERAEMPIVMANVADPAIFDKGYKWVFATPDPVYPSWSKSFFDMMKTVKPKPKTIYFVIAQTPTTVGIAKASEKLAREAGLRVVGSSTFQVGATNFTSTVLKIKSKHPDVIYISSFDTPSAPLIREMADMSVHPLGIYHAIATERLEALVGSDMDGVFSEIPWFPGVAGPYSDFASQLMKETGISMFKEMFTVSRIDAYLVMVQAIEDAGSLNRAAVRDALRNQTFRTPSGLLKFAGDGLPERTPAFTDQIQHGTAVVVAPATAGSVLHKPVWPWKGWGK